MCENVNIVAYVKFSGLTSDSKGIVHFGFPFCHNVKSTSKVLVPDLSNAIFIQEKYLYDLDKVPFFLFLLFSLTGNSCLLDFYAYKLTDSEKMQN